MQIAIASGKGGTGKTTLAVNLAATLLRQNLSVALADCDVEEPNAHLFLPSNEHREREVSLPVPEIDHQACLGESCQSCIYLCRFKALIWMVDEVMPFTELCHGCGLCQEACPAHAITEGTRLIGSLHQAKTTSGLDLIHGRMRVGEAMAPPLIREVKDTAAGLHKDILLLDCPPGTSCPMIASVQGSDAAILVTEPTPFGLHDLKLAVETLRQLGIPFGVLINRHGLGDDRVETYLQAENIPLLGRIPHSKDAARAASRGALILDALPGMESLFHQVWQATLALPAQHPEEIPHA